MIKGKGKPRAAFFAVTRTALRTARFARTQTEHVNLTDAKRELRLSAGVLNSGLIQTYFPEYRSAQKRESIASLGKVRFQVPNELFNKFVKEMTKPTDGTRPSWQLAKQTAETE